MPLWLQILCVFLSILFLIMLFDMILTLFICGHAVRNNIIFRNKYQRKIYVLKEKSKRYAEKIKDQISKLEYKSIYCENMKILHERELGMTIMLTSKDFTKINKKKGK